MRSRRSLLAAVWLGGVLLATGVGVLAVRLVADQVGDPAVPVLSSGDVKRALASASPTSSPTASPQPTVAPTRTTTATRTTAPGTTSRPTPPRTTDAPRATATRQPTTSAVKAFSSRGGSVGVRCHGTTPERVYATPAQGYRLDEANVQGSVLEVRFENDSTRVRLEISCSTGRPVLIRNRVDEDNSGSG